MERVRKDAVSASIAYVVGLVALLAWPDRQTANQLVVLLVGTAVFVVTGVVVDWLAFGQRPTIGWPRPVTRPGRSWVPGFLGLFLGIVYSGSLWNRSEPDAGLTAYLVALPLMLVGLTASNLLWARATRASGG